eukprot:TRINITY_DN858_c0_g2_i1.p1 TRINITY_DN858_c0_g2~~TRINITY_DN858_c0_g2_i1.p1  ORF type:complete len:166 (-),score=19.30 TRINITY_DN858_c0_g2_i1:28-498(-)
MHVLPFCLILVLLFDGQCYKFKELLSVNVSNTAAEMKATSVADANFTMHKQGQATLKDAAAKESHVDRSVFLRPSSGHEGIQSFADLRSNASVGSSKDRMVATTLPVDEQEPWYDAFWDASIFSLLAGLIVLVGCCGAAALCALANSPIRPSWLAL